MLIFVGGPIRNQLAAIRRISRPWEVLLVRVSRTQFGGEPLVYGG